MRGLKLRSIDGGLLCLRLLFGIGICYHGWGKVFGGRMDRFTEGVASMGFPLPALFAWAAALSELVGGALLALGLWTQVAAAFILMTMLVAAFVRHGPDPFRDKELALAYASAALALLVTGAGRYSLDARLERSAASSSSEPPV